MNITGSLWNLWSWAPTNGALLWCKFHQLTVGTCNHKLLGLYYIWYGIVFGLSGTLCSLIIRYELYYSGARIINSQNHNYYNLNITLHGLIMIFFLIMPILYGGFGNYIIPINNISLDIGFPRINNFSLLLLPISYLFIIIYNHFLYIFMIINR